MERHWSALILDSRKETYTRVFAGRLLHFLYNRLELFSSECVDYASIGNNFLKALDEVCVYMVPLTELYLTKWDATTDRRYTDRKSCRSLLFARLLAE